MTTTMTTEEAAATTTNTTTTTTTTTNSTFRFLADCTNSWAYGTMSCPSVCHLSVTYLLWLNDTYYRKTV